MSDPDERDLLRADLTATHDALDRLLSLVWRQDADLDAVRRAADRLRVNHVRRQLPVTVSFLKGQGPQPRLCLKPGPDPDEHVCCVLYREHEGCHGYPALGLYW